MEFSGLLSQLHSVSILNLTFAGLERHVPVGSKSAKTDSSDEERTDELRLRLDRHSCSSSFRITYVVLVRKEQ